ncbi:MAG: metal-dependent transcriptional regulator [Lewinellaceae bacterium]|nr:metal-dependent transcriptional regulator [Lewinellaceae bacterium]
MLSQVEENYLKSIFKITEKEGKPASTNAIAGDLQTTAASVTDMLKRLSEKTLIHYEKYKGVQMSDKGLTIATQLVRRHRLWEVFLVEKLEFAWDEVHDLAEQLEHIHGNSLIDRLDAFLGNPRFDPHGDPIPDAQGRWTRRKQILLSALEPGEKGIVSGVENHSPEFLQYLDQLGLVLHTQITLRERFPYDQSVRIRTDDGRELSLSEKVAANLYVEEQSGTKERR